MNILGRRAFGLTTWSPSWPTRSRRPERISIAARCARTGANWPKARLELAAARPGKSGRLKVYQAGFGFHESVVAASSQKAALRLWGARQNLFAEGQAHVTTDAAAVGAALAHPQTPLRRAVGSDGPFVLDPAEASPPKLPDAPKRLPDARPKKPKQKPAKTSPNRSGLRAAEASVLKIERDLKRWRELFQGRRAALEAEEAEAERRFARARVAAERRFKRERDAYAADGEDREHGDTST
jgi:hypothetical protein